MQYMWTWLCNTTLTPLTFSRPDTALGMTDVSCEQPTWQQFAAEDGGLLKALTPYLQYSKGANLDPSCFPGADVELDLSVLGDDTVTLASVVELFRDELDIPVASAHHIPTSACWGRQQPLTKQFPAEPLAGSFSSAGGYAVQPAPQPAVLTPAGHNSQPLHVQPDPGNAAQSPRDLAVLTPNELPARLTPLRTHAGPDHAAARPACPAGPPGLPVLQPFLSDVSTSTQFSILQAAAGMADPSTPHSQHLASGPISNSPGPVALPLHTSTGLLGLGLPMQSATPGAGGLPATDLQVLLHNYRVLAQHVSTATAAANGPGTAHTASSSQRQPVAPHSPIQSPAASTAATSCASPVFILKDGELLELQASMPGSSSTPCLSGQSASPYAASAGTVQAAGQRQGQSSQDSGWVYPSGNLILTLQHSLSMPIGQQLPIGLCSLPGAIGMHSPQGMRSTDPAMQLQPGRPAGHTAAEHTHDAATSTQQCSMIGVQEPLLHTAAVSTHQCAAVGVREPSIQAAAATTASAQAAVAAALAAAKAVQTPEGPAVGSATAAAGQRRKGKARSPAGTSLQELASTETTAGPQSKRARTRTAKAMAAAAAAVSPSAIVTESKSAAGTAFTTNSAAAAAVSAVKADPRPSKAVPQGSAAGSGAPTFCEMHGSSYPAVLTGVSRSALGDCWEVRYSGSISQDGLAAAASEEVFLGGFATECEAVHAYDLAAFACEGRGAVTNFHTREYGADPGQLYCAGVEAVLGCISNNQLTMTGFHPPFDGVYPSMGLEGKWEARLYSEQDESRYRYLGSFSNEFAAASAVDAAKAALNSVNSTCTCRAQRQT